MTIENRTGPDKVVAGSVGPNHVVLIRTGMGPEKARASAALALGNQASNPTVGIGPMTEGDQAPQCVSAVLVFGLAGSLSHSVQEGDLVFYERCLSDGDKAPVVCSRHITTRLIESLGAGDVSCREVTGISVPRVASSRTEKRGLARLGAEVVDMESYEVIAEAHRRGIPAVVLRAVSDSLDREMPDFNRALNSHGEFDTLALARVCAARPIASAALAATSWRAMRRMKKALDIIFSQAFPEERERLPEGSSGRLGCALI